VLQSTNITGVSSKHTVIYHPNVYLSYNELVFFPLDELSQLFSNQGFLLSPFQLITASSKA